MISVICPICKQPMQGQSLAEWPDFPFCSRRCKTIDLGRWLGEAYRLPADEEGDQEAPSDPRETEVP
jgi:endogenous inhibitor of DNA gyrase (YacG/DUF329 family)